MGLRLTLARFLENKISATQVAEHLDLLLVRLEDDQQGELADLVCAFWETFESGQPQAILNQGESLLDALEAGGYERDSDLPRRILVLLEKVAGFRRAQVPLSELLAVISEAEQNLAAARFTAEGFRNTQQVHPELLALFLAGTQQVESGLQHLREGATSHQMDLLTQGTEQVEAGTRVLQQTEQWMVDSGVLSS